MAGKILGNSNSNQRSKIRLQIAVLVLGTCVLNIYHMVQSRPLTSFTSAIIFQDITSSLKSKISSKNEYYSCETFQKYDAPANHSGLPQLADVFRDARGTHVVFVATNRDDNCVENSRQSDSKFFFDRSNGRGTRFLCEFQPGNHKVFSDYVQPRDRGMNPTFQPSFSFQCQIPTEIRETYHIGSRSTQVSVTLYALQDNDLENAEKPPLSTPVVEGFHSVPDIPVCSNIWYSPDTPENLSIDGSNNNDMNNHTLTVFTLLKSASFNYKQNFIRHRDLINNNVNHLYEWIEYHRELGVDHFVIYDNDDPPGQLRAMLLPYIQHGTVTLVWFPVPMCMDERKWETQRGQYVAEISALHRYGPYTKYYVDIDVDEFLYLGSNTTNDPPSFSAVTSPSLVAFLDSKMENTALDVVRFRPYAFDTCNGTKIAPGMLLMEKRRCFTGLHQSDYKLVMKPERMLHYVVHYPHITKDWSSPNITDLDDATEGMLVHYQNTGTFPNDAHDDFSSVVETPYQKKLPIMDAVLPRVKERLRQAETEYGINTTKLWVFTNATR